MRSWGQTARFLPLLATLAVFASCSRITSETVTPDSSPPIEVSKPMTPPPSEEKPSPAEHQTATFGAGCFWCVEAVYQELKGVVAVESGYAGGHVENPTYEQICTKTTGHAEVCQIKFDANKTSFGEILQVFWQTHDPTTKDRQGNDEGPQYRSVIYTHDEAQLEQANALKKDLDASGSWPNPIVTEIEPLKNYYKAEAYHQNYYRNNPNQGYCAYVIQPKMERFRKVFRDKLKK